MGKPKKGRRQKRPRKSPIATRPVHSDPFYAEQLKFAEAVLERGAKKSAAIGNHSVEYRRGMATWLYTRQLIQLRTLLSVVPYSKHSGPRVGWDYASIATLTRALVDSGLMMHYLCIDDVPEAEADARIKLTHLHDYTARIAMFERIESQGSPVKWDEAEFRSRSDALRTELSQNDYFNTLTEKQRKHFLSGKYSRFLSDDEIAQRLEADIDEFRWYYNFLSQETHSLPMAFHGMSDGQRGHWYENEADRKFIAIAVHYAATVVNTATEAIEAMYPQPSETGTIPQATHPSH